MSILPGMSEQSSPIRVGGESMTPYRWAAKLTSDQLIPYKNAMLWLEGEDFDSVEQFLDKVKRVIAFQEAENHRPTATITPPTVIEEPKETEATKEEEWGTVAKAASRRPSSSPGRGNNWPSPSSTAACANAPVV